MQLQADQEFNRFVQHRVRLNEQLDSDKAAIDDWLDTHLDNDVSVVELGLLEGLLKTRTDHLNELASLDDSFMDHLVELLGKETTS